MKMAKHNLCSPNLPFADAQSEQANLVLEAQRIVVWAGELSEFGEPVGGIGTQLNRAARLLQLHPGVVWRARYKRAGPEIFPTIWEARNALVEREATVQSRMRRAG